MTLIAANIMGKLLYTTSLQWMNTLLCDYRPITGKCFATHLASLSCWVYKKMPIQKSASLTVSMRKNQSNFRWLTNQKAGYVYRNLDWFEKWQSGNGNIAWSYQCPTVIFDRLLAFRCLIQQWIVPAEDKREKNWTINHLWYHNISSILLEYTDVPPTSLLS